MNRDIMRLEHILNSCARIGEIIKNLDFEAFKQDFTAQEALIFNLQVIGEATKNLSDELKFEHDDLPWADIAAMRNIIVHEYFNVDLGIVWQTAQTRIPELQKRVKEVKASK